MEKGAAPFGDLLKLRRIASGISQERLAELARMSASAVSALERGVRRAPYRETVALLSSALGLTPEEQAELEDAAQRARARPSGAAGEPPLVHNLTTRLTSFVGRSEEIAELKELLSEHRLLTVSGSGGVGKTRFAVETARQLLGERFPEARFVDLSPVEDGAFVPSAIAAALDFQLPEVAEPLRALASSIKTRTLLLILDNCEHVIDDTASAIVEILRACPSITILATSRERIALEGERVYRLPSLPVPDDVPATIEEACTYASFRLFVERATSSDGHFTPTAGALKAVSEICRRLEGIPLALELAATRLPVLGLETLNERLKGHILTTSGARDLPQRQQTMLATIAWSYDLLSAQEQHLLGRLAVFRGAITLGGASSALQDRRSTRTLIPQRNGPESTSSWTLFESSFLPKSSKSSWPKGRDSISIESVRKPSASNRFKGRRGDPKL
jgi:transcriptional regulator with XRE-family HTH domain